ncbi:NAD(P)-binding protein [Lipomyces tetrasporus]
MSRNVCITAVDGHTGFLIAELLLTDPTFKRGVDSLIGLSMHSSAAKCKELTQLGAKIVPHKPGRERDMATTLKELGADTICLIPPTHKDKYDISVELVNAAKKANIQNVCLVSAAGCDLADPQKQPRLREFIDLEQIALAPKGDPDTALGHSPVVIRAGFYAENLLLYAPQAQKDGLLPLPIGQSQKFAPVALRDVAQVAAHVLTSKGKQGFSDKVRGQLIALTGPMLAAGNELATATSRALGVDMKFENISEAEAKRVLHSQSDSDNSELQYLLEYYSLVREGKTNYISTLAFHDITGRHPMELQDFFKTYEEEFLPHHRQKKRKLNDK